jgi:uncharacterized membrane protein
MTRTRIWALIVALPLVLCGLVYAAWHATNSRESTPAQGYICPLTGEELPCRQCCPLDG